MPEQFVESTYEADVTTLTLDRQPHNIMNIEMMEQVDSPCSIYGTIVSSRCW